MKTDVQREHSESMWLREDVIWMSEEQWDWYIQMLEGTLSEMVQDPPIILESSPYAEGEGLLWEKWDEVAMKGVLEIPHPPPLSDAPPIAAISTGSSLPDLD